VARALQIPILMYHSVSDACAPRFRRFAVRPATFEAQMRYLSEQGFTTLTISDLIEAMSGRVAMPRKPVVVTFDDGFADFYEAALPVLQQYGQTATLYVVSGAVGKTSTWLDSIGGGARPMVSWSNLIEIQKCGIEIGAHTVTHAALDLLPTAAVKDEIANSKRMLEDGLGRPVVSFAYPFGYQNATVRDVVKAEGYSSACAVQYRMCVPHDDPFALPRHIALDGWDNKTFAAVLEGRPQRFPNFLDRTRSHAWRAARRAVGSFYP
jgi:peptidoglycan/xylan/chitin deacetylase (PgdA/CDA1 family)